MRNGGVVDECLGIENQPVPIDTGRGWREHFDADASESAAFSELELGMMLLPKFPFARISRPEGESQLQGLIFLGGLNVEDLAILAGPELIRLHTDGTNPRLPVLTSDQCGAVHGAPPLSITNLSRSPLLIMKNRFSFPTLIASLALLGTPPSVAQENAAPAAPATTPEAQLSDTEMLEIYGWMAGMRVGISRLGLSDEEMKAFAKGIDAARSNQDLDVDLQAVGPMISQFVQTKFEAHMENLQAAEEAKSEVYWTEILAQDGVQSLESGLAYTIIEPGSTVKPTATDTVRVHYTGKLVDGTVFDTSEGGGPFVSRLDEMIEGWTQGVPLIGEGGSIKLFIPAKLGYGDAGSGRIPPGATLVFDVELIEVLPSETPVAETSSE